MNAHVDPTLTREHDHRMEIMGRSGHDTITWNPNDPESVAHALAEFNRYIRDGYHAWRMRPRGNNAVVEQKDVRVTEFNAEDGRLLLIPHLVSG